MLWPGWQFRQWLWSPWPLQACCLSVALWTQNRLVLLWQHLALTQPWGPAMLSTVGPNPGPRGTSNHLAQVWLWLPNCPCSRSSAPSYIVCAFRLATCSPYRAEELSLSNIWGFKVEINAAKALNSPFLSTQCYVLHYRQCNISLQQLNLFILLNVKSLSS